MGNVQRCMKNRIKFGEVFKNDRFTVLISFYGSTFLMNNIIDTGSKILLSSEKLHVYKIQLLIEYRITYYSM